jgi:hypothetical protein
MADTFIQRLEASAAAAEREEAEFRASYRDRLEQLERQRSFAHRRAAFARKLAASVDGAEDEAAAMAAGNRLLFEEFGLSEANPAHRPIVAEFSKVADEADTALNCEGEADHAAVLAALAAFEAWYEARTGIAFYALYDVYMPQTPVVDF